MVREVRGFTLIELLVVIAVIAILSGIGLNGYGKWKRNISVESDVRELYSTIQETRMKAFISKDPAVIHINGKDVTVKDITADKTIGFLKLKNPFGNKTIEVSGRGLFSNSLKVACATPNVNPDYNCVVISKYRVRMGCCK